MKPLTVALVIDSDYNLLNGSPKRFLDYFAISEKMIFKDLTKTDDYGINMVGDAQIMSELVENALKSNKDDLTQIVRNIPTDADFFAKIDGWRDQSIRGKVIF
jgi:hypothetical protein